MIDPQFADAAAHRLHVARIPQGEATDPDQNASPLLLIP